MSRPDGEGTDGSAGAHRRRGGELAVRPGELPTPPDVTVTADVVSFCRPVGGPIRPADFSHRTEGDGELGRELVETAASFALP